MNIVAFLVDLALAKRDSKNAVVSVFVGGTYFVGHAFPTKTAETGDKNCGDFHCMQMSLVMSMQYIFGDDWNDACKFGNDVILLEWRPLIFMYGSYAWHVGILKRKYPQVG